MLVDGITLADLQVFSDAEGCGGLAALFAPTETVAGRTELHRRLLSPESNLAELRELQDAVRFFADTWATGLLGRDLIHPVDRYLGSNIDLGPVDRPWRDRVQGAWLPLRDGELWRELRDGIRASSEVLVVGTAAAERLLASNPPSRVHALATRILELRRAIVDIRPALGFHRTIRADRHVRFRMRSEMLELLHSLARLDALRTMGATTRDRGWVFPRLLDGERFLLEAKGLHHPFLENPVGNPVQITGGEPVVFLTGPNMAGKTTLMRAVGVAALLAQLGMGVPATSMSLTPADLILTGLNPSDNVRAGLSFFFAEVLRVKEAAERVATGKRCLLLFDEVFRGTNVRDALAASEEVITGFARSHHSGCLFSSHLVELAESLAEVGRVRFVQLEGDIVDGRATYSYRLRPGVSDRRFGLQLLEEAGVPALLERIASLGRAS